MSCNFSHRFFVTAVIYVIFRVYVAKKITLTLTLTLTRGEYKPCWNTNVVCFLTHILFITIWKRKRGQPALCVYLHQNSNFFYPLRIKHVGSRKWWTGPGCNMLRWVHILFITIWKSKCGQPAPRVYLHQNSIIVYPLRINHVVSRKCWTGPGCNMLRWVTPTSRIKWVVLIV